MHTALAMPACMWLETGYVQRKKLNEMHVLFNYERSIRVLGFTV